MTHQAAGDALALIAVFNHERHFCRVVSEAAVSCDADDAAACAGGCHDRSVMHAVNLGKGMRQWDREFQFRPVEPMLNGCRREPGVEPSQPLPIVAANRSEMDVMDTAV